MSLPSRSAPQPDPEPKDPGRFEGAVEHAPASRSLEAPLVKDMALWSYTDSYVLGLFLVWPPPATLQQSVLVLFSVFYISFVDSPFCAKPPLPLNSRQCRGTTKTVVSSQPLGILKKYKGGVRL